MQTRAANWKRPQSQPLGSNSTHIIVSSETGRVPALVPRFEFYLTTLQHRFFNLVGQKHPLTTATYQLFTDVLPLGGSSQTDVFVGMSERTGIQNWQQDTA